MVFRPQVGEERGDGVGDVVEEAEADGVEGVECRC